MFFKGYRHLLEYRNFLKEKRDRHLLKYFFFKVLKFSKIQLFSKRQTFAKMQTFAKRQTFAKTQIFAKR